MLADPIAFCLERLPEVFATLKAAAIARAEAGDARAQKRLADLNAASATARVVFTGEGGGEVFLAADRGELRVTRQAPAQPSVRYALAIPRVSAELGLGSVIAERARAASERDPLPGFASARADKLFSTYKFAFDVQLSGVPDVPGVDALLLRVALGRDLPATPEFTVRAAYGDLADARARGAGMQELVATGKISVTGDAAKAMMFAMTLTQLR